MSTLPQTKIYQSTKVPKSNNYQSILPLARLDCVGNNCRHGTKRQLRFIAVGNQLHQLSFYLSHTYRDPTIPTTQYGELCQVTLYHTYPLLSNHQTSTTFLGDKKTGDSSRTNPPLACNTQQYAAQMTLIQNTHIHLGAFTAPSGCPQYPESPS